MTAPKSNVHYIKYHHISDDPALIAKGELLVNLYKKSKQQQRKNTRDFAAAFNVILTSVDIFQAYDGWSLYIPLTTTSLVEPLSATAPIQQNFLMLSNGSLLRAILSRSLA